MEPFLSLRHVGKTFYANRALSDIGLDFAPGKVYCLVGQSGCGKSTLIKVISGVYRPNEGTAMTLSGKTWSKLASVAFVVRGIQVIYQDLSLFPNLSAWENIAINRYHRGTLVRRSELRCSTEQAMRSINISLPLDAAVESLSIARCQLVAICRALAQDAQLTIMDELTVSLTHQEVEGLLHAVHQLRERGICIVFASRRLGEIMTVSDRISVPKNGNLVGTLPVAETITRWLDFLMMDREFDYQVRDLWQGRDNMSVLKVHNLCRRGECHNASLKVEAGGVMSVVGLLDAGRTGLCLNLFGMTHLDSDEILTSGQPVQSCSDQDAIRYSIGYVSEDRMSRGLVMSQLVENNIINTVFRKVKGACGLLSDSRAQQPVARMANVLTIKTPDTHLSVNTLSDGNVQRVSIAKWLAISPKPLILDSPTVGVDIANRAEIYHIISDLAVHGIAMLMTCDEIEGVWCQSYHILVMKQGELTYNFPPGSSTQQQIAEVANGQSAEAT